MATAEIGFQAVLRAIKEHGGVDIVEHKEGRKRFITFTGLDGKKYKVFSRSKKVGTWQTTIEYGEKQEIKKDETDFWVFVDIAFDPPKFYPVPFSWISNDIFETHQKVMEPHGGQRKNNNDSTHHAIQLRRIKKWENNWECCGLQVQKK